MKLSEIAARLGLAWEGADVAVTRPALIEDVEPGVICLATTADFAARAAKQQASAVLAPPDVQTDLPCLRSDKPRIAFAYLLALFDNRPQPPAGVHPSAIVAASASVAPDASIGPYAVVEAGAIIGARTVVGANCYVGSHSRIGDDCRLDPNSTVHHNCTLGNRVRLQSGAVVGGEGFGYEWDGHQHVAVPHIGTVVLEDDVHLGVGSAVDRAKTGETRVGRGTKLDNHVQIGHGVRVGSFVLMAAQVGIGGSTVVGDGTVLAGQVGVADAVTIGPGAVVAGQSGIVGSVAGGKTYMGTPVREIGDARRIIAAEARLPSVMARLRALERRVHDLESGGEAPPDSRPSSPKVL